MAFKWWKCRVCFNWNWVADRAQCPRCKRFNTDAQI